MSFSDLLRTAFLNLWRRKMRAFLTVLGMVIGVASIVVMVSLGIGIRQATVASYAGTGSLTTIQVNSWSSKQMANGQYSSSEKELNRRSVETFKKIAHVKAVMPMVEAYGMLTSGRYMSDVNLLGVEAESAEEFGFILAEGEMPGSTRGNTVELVLGSWVLGNFYNPDNYKQAYDRDGNPLVTLNSRFQMTFDWSNVYKNNGDSGESGAKGKFYKINVVGQMAQEGSNYSYYTLIELSKLEKLMKENSNFIGGETGKYNNVLVKVDDLANVKEVKNAIEDLGYGTYSLQDAVEEAEKSTQRVQYLLGAIGGVALLVAAIGIVNTMMMSIYERTREIGVIKVLGCRMGNIAALFLTEAAYIGLFGGALGLAVSYGLSLILNAVLQGSGLMSIIPVYLALGAVAFSVFVALVAGLYPSIRAMKLSPLAAIRNE